MRASDLGFIGRVVEVLVDGGVPATPHWTIGSGLLIGGRRVLTSAHVLTDVHTVYVRAIRTANSDGQDPQPRDTPHHGTHVPNVVKEMWRATVIDAGDPAIADIALLEVSDQESGGTDEIVNLPTLRFAQIDRHSALPQVIAACSAVGFPKFMEYADAGSPAQATPTRETVHVSGEIPTLDRLVSGLLTLRVKNSPQPLPPRAQALHESVWSGMSGAVVVADDVVLGVVTEHFPRAGDSQLTVTPITHVDRLPPARQQVWQRALGIDLAKLPMHQAKLEPTRTFIRPSSNTITVALVTALIGGIVAGLLARQWAWGLTFAAMTLAAVVCGNAGIKLLRISSALESASQRANGSSAQPPAAAPENRTVEVTANKIDMRNSVIAAGDVNQSRQTNIRLGGFAALAVAAALALIGSVGTAAISSSPGTSAPTDIALVPTSVSRPGVVPTPSATRPVVTGANLNGRALKERDQIASDGVHAVVATWVWNDDPWRPQPYYESYEVATGAPVQAKTSPGAVADGSCGFLLVRLGNHSIILDMITSQQPARGIEKARITESLRAIDASTMNVLWTTQIVEGTTDEVSGCNPAGWGLQDAFVTHTGGYLLLSSMVVDLAAGQAKHVEGAWSGIGDWVAVEGNDHLLLVDPGSGATVGTLERWRHFLHGDESSFGAGLFVSRGETTSGLAGYALPSGTIAWRTTYNPISRYIRYDKKTNAFIFSDLAYGADEVLAVSATDGRTLWGPIDSNGICGVDNGRVVVSVNGQVAVLDAATGTQLSYDKTTAACPTVLPGLLLRKDGSGQTVQLF